MKITKLAVATALIIGGASSSVSALEVYNDKENTLTVGGFFNIGYISGDGYDELADLGSRVNFEFTRQLRNGWTGFAKAEWAVNTVNSNSNLSINGQGRLAPGAADDTISTRLGYIGAKHDTWGSITLGKQWGTIYNITAPTDMLNAFGAEAAGSFNMGTDGGYTGAGRAEQAIQYSNTFGNLFVSAQIQATENNVNIDQEFLNNLPENGIPGTIIPSDLNITYDNSYAVAAIYSLPMNFKVGVGYNIANIEVNSESMPSVVDDIEDTMLAAHISYGAPGSYGFYAAVVASETENHEMDNEGNLIDANGLEAVAAYRFGNDIEILVALNQLSADENNNDYEMAYTVAGVGYYWADNVKVFVEYKMDDTTMANGDSFEDANGAKNDVIAIGGRYIF